MYVAKMTKISDLLVSKDEVISLETVKKNIIFSLPIQPAQMSICPYFKKSQERFILLGRGKSSHIKV